MWKKEYSRQHRYYLKNKKKCCEASKKSFNKNRENNLAKKRLVNNERSKIRKERYRIYMESFVKEHYQEIMLIKTLGEAIKKKKKSIRSKKYYARKMNAKGSFTTEEWGKLKKKYGYKCAICGKKEPFKNQYYKFLEQDHIIPLIKKGSSFIENIQPTCHKCNCLKMDKIDISYNNVV